MPLPLIKVLVVANQFTRHDLRLLSSILNHKKGFGQIARFQVECDKKRYYLGERPEKGTATILVAGKFRSDQIKHVFPYEDGIQEMSFTFMGLKQPIIVFNHNNWQHGSKAYMDSAAQKYPGKSKEELLQRYRIYLVNHEFGHALGMDHETRTEHTCPLMYQHTKGIGGCAQDQNWPSAANIESTRRFLSTHLIHK